MKQFFFALSMFISISSFADLNDFSAHYQEEICKAGADFLKYEVVYKDYVNSGEEIFMTSDSFVEELSANCTFTESGYSYIDFRLDYNFNLKSFFKLVVASRIVKSDVQCVLADFDLDAYSWSCGFRSVDELEATKVVYIVEKICVKNKKAKLPVSECPEFYTSTTIKNNQVIDSNEWQPDFLRKLEAYLDDNY